MPDNESNKRPKRVGQILIDDGYIDQETLDKAISKQSTGKGYTQKQLQEVKKEPNQDQKMNFLIDMMDNNTTEIERIRNKLYNGWNEQIIKNSIFRRGGLWLMGTIIVSALAYAISLL